MIATESLSESFSIPLLAASAAMAVAWVVLAIVAAGARRPPRIRAGEATMDLPDQSPAVAGLLVDDFRVPSETAPAVLLDLAARDLVDLDEVQPGRTICRLRQAPDTQLTPYEQRVLDSLRTKEVDGIVPADALTTGPETQSRSWHRELEKEVVAESQASGLTYDRWPKRIVAALGSLVGVALILGALAIKDDTKTAAPSDQVPVLMFIVIGVAVAFFVGASYVTGRMGRSLAQLPTDAGRDATARAEGLARHLRDDHVLAELPPAAVKIRGRHLAYAAAFGLAPLAVSLLPMGAEDDRRAWSRFGGRWRRVRVRYPQHWPPAWGQRPGVAVFFSLVRAAIAALVMWGLAALADAARPIEVPPSDWRWVERGALLAMIPFALLGLWGVLVLLRAVPDIWSTRTVTGDVVRARHVTHRSSRGSEQSIEYLAVDDGTADHIDAWIIRNTKLWGQPQGQTVTAQITPRLGYVRTLERAKGQEPQSRESGA